MIEQKIDPFHIKDLSNPDHPSVFFQHEDYDLLILRLPEQSDPMGEIEYISDAFIMSGQGYFHYNKSTNELDKLNGMEGFYQFINKRINHTLHMISHYFSEIEVIEDQLYEGEKPKEFNKRWFGHKKNLTRIERVLNRTLSSLEKMMAQHQNDSDFLERHFEDLQEHLHRASRNTGLLLEKLDSIYNFNLTQTNEQMNHTVYVLTILSGIFLPLNLMVGFFGMNTTSLPFTEGSGGTLNVILLLVGVGLVTAWLGYWIKRHWG